MKNDTLRVLCLDIENFPCEVYSWGLGDVHLPLEFLKRDWTVCAWSAHWVGSPADEIMYMDNRGRRDIYDDKQLIKGLVDLMNHADVIIGQNVMHFDIRKLAARAAFHKLPPFRPVKITDILTEERRVFAFTSHKLAYKTELLNERYKKLKHEKFPGFDLWKACMADKLDAWKEMEVYCKHDVFSTEEHYLKIQGWIRTHALGPADGVTRCKCGSTNLESRGYAHTDAGKWRIYHCRDCKKWPRSPVNLLTKGQKSGRLRESL
jgi:hypothetical protein